MRKLCRNSTVHPSPPPPASSDPLAFLPAAIFSLAAALSSEDKEVLAYLLNSSCNSNNTINPSSRKDRKGCSFYDHSVTFSCSCFRCYMSYWIRWDSSPNRQLIHEIIDSFEDNLLEASKETDKGSRKSRRKKGKKSLRKLTELTGSQLTVFDSVQTRVRDVDDVSKSVDVDDDDDDEDGPFSDDGLEFDKGSMRKFVSFVGERIWGVLGGKE